MAQNIRISGLATFKNELTRIPGSQKIANNIVIDKDDTAEPRRGFNDYGTVLPETDDRVKQLLRYKGRILRHFDSIIQYDSDGSGVFESFAGTYDEVETNFRIKYQEANSNLYFTTATGVKKISARSSSDFTTNSGFITDAGVAEALDIQGSVQYQSGGWFSPESKVAYRVVWGITDRNENLLLGSPSSRYIITNPDSTQSAIVNLNFAIPQSIDNLNYFYQVYRTGVVSGTPVDDLEPGDEMNLVFESGVTQTQLNAGIVEVQDITPESFRVTGALLYTNPVSGEGILQANTRPPICKDIENFRNSTFYANTKTEHQRNLTLVSVDDYTSGTSNVIIGNGVRTRKYTFVGETQVQTITALAKADLSDGDFFRIFSAQDEIEYTVWYDVSGTGTAPDRTSTDGTSFVRVDLSVVGSAANDTATATETALEATGDFTVTVSGADFTVTLNKNGNASNAVDGDSTGGTTGAATGFTFAAPSTEGDGQGRRGTINTITVGSPTNIESTAHGLQTGDIVYFDNTEITNTTLSEEGYTVTVIDADNFTIPIDTTGETVNSSGIFFQTDALVSSQVSVGAAIDETARSLVRAINRDELGIVYAQYISGVNDLPGQILLKARNLTDDTFYIATSDATIAGEFNPELPVENSITSISTGSVTTVTSSAHGLSSGDEVFIYETDSTPEVYGTFTVTVVNANEFTIEQGVTVAGTTGNFIRTSVASDNLDKPNRIYYSKPRQPESVPIVNFLEVGTEDDPIERIIALRDNLFVLKTDGVYIVTGSGAPNFGARSIDDSAPILAPDSATILSNQIYMLSTQGIVKVSDTGVSIVSRNIEDLILRVTRPDYTFRLPTFALGYESDRAYIIWLPTQPGDTSATQAYRYNIFTKSWTRWDYPATAGIINTFDDTIYVGNTDRNIISKERKNFDRTDYSDRNFSVNLLANGVDENVLSLGSLTNISLGDVLLQTQYLTIPRFNRVLGKLDRDPGFNDTNYLSTLEAVRGDNLADKLSQLVTKLNLDDSSITYTTPSGTNSATAIRDDYNTLVDELNTSGSDSVFKSYTKYEEELIYEVPIDALNKDLNKVTVTYSVPFQQGNLQVYKAINSDILWNPEDFGDAGTMKQVYQCTMIFDQKQFYRCRAEFSTDLSPAFEGYNFFGDGPGFFGSLPFGNGYFGGGASDKPFRTYVPRQKQRGRYLNFRFKHTIAREGFKLIGLTATPRATSRRGYR